MSKDKAAVSGSFLQQLFHFGVYKRSQGRVTRQVTFGAFATIIALGALRLWYFLRSVDDGYRYGSIAAILLVGLWLSFRLVNYPRFADFLIAVEAEVNKVSWPSRTELWRSAIVVIVVIFTMAVLLYVYDIFWVAIFENVLGILNRPSG